MTSQTFTLTGIPDMDARDELVFAQWYIWGTISGESPNFRVRVVDTGAPNYLASNWNVSVPASGSATFDVTLTQPPSAPITVALQLSPDDAMHVTVSPATLSFDATNSTVPQTVTVTRTDAMFFAYARINLQAAGEFPEATVSVVAPYEESGYP